MYSFPIPFGSIVSLFVCSRGQNTVLLTLIMFLVPRGSPVKKSSCCSLMWQANFVTTSLPCYNCRSFDSSCVVVCIVTSSFDSGHDCWLDTKCSYMCLSLLCVSVPLFVVVLFFCVFGVFPMYCGAVLLMNTDWLLYICYALNTTHVVLSNFPSSIDWIPLSFVMFYGENEFTSD